MSTNQLFADSSSSEDEDFTPGVDKAEEEESEGSKDKADKKDEKDKAATNPLFGDDSDSSDDSDFSEGDLPPKKKKVVEEEQDDDDDKMDEDEKKTPSTPKPKSSVMDDSDDDDDEEAKLDDIVGSSQVTKPTVTTDSAVEVSDKPTTPAVRTSKPPENATVLPAERPNDGVSLHMTKLPNLVAIQPNAFDESIYLEKEEEEQYKGYVHNMIRWRYKQNAKGEMERDSDGNLIRESNSKLVKWSDGSYTLHIGTEAFNIQTVDSSSNKFAGLNGYLYLSQKATYNDDGGVADGTGGTVLECVGPIASRLVPKPSSLQSEAHKSLTLAVRQRTIKRAKIAEYVTQEDPEKAKAERIKTNQEEDKIRARKRANYRANTSRHRTPGMNRQYMEEDDDDYDTTNISAMKRGVAMEDDMDDYGDESDDDYDDTFKSRNRKRQKKALEEEEEDEDEEELIFDDDEDDEDEVAAVKAPKTKRSQKNVIEDEDSD